ncbi:MAG TPA: hypothetical protein VFP87_06455 [Chitinophagaceae bacterium]|nr:hypothetical protein [Chitinophagaceae bacterium]
METHAQELHKAPSYGLKHYLFEFLMLFLAVFCGFLAENYRETLVNKEKAHHYIQNLVADLKADTADVNFAIYYNQLWNDHLDSALQVPIDRLKDINTQDTFYYHFLPYYSWLQPFVQNDNTITQLKAGGFNFIRNETVVDSINMVYNFYRNASFNNSYNYTCYWDIARKAQELMDMPAPPTSIGEDVPKHVLQNKEVFVKYDMPAIHQLYSMIRNAKGSFATTIDFEKQYKEKAERLLTYLQKEYDLK